MKEADVYDIYIQRAYAEKEYDEVIYAFLDILEYDATILKPETYNICLYSNKNIMKDKIYFDLLQVILLI